MNIMLTVIVILLFMGGLARSGLLSQPFESAENPLVEFMLYTWKHPTEPMLLAQNASDLETTDFNSTCGSVIIVHGFTGSHIADTVIAIRNAYLEGTSLNVIVLDWWQLARGPLYETAANNTKRVAQILANFLDGLMLQIEEPILDDLHVIGFSLGAQVAGIAASRMRSGVLPRITALDPAKPIFDMQEIAERLDASDAKFVQVIHTAGGLLSFFQPVGHADFYPNSGMSPQPGCSGDTALQCSHFMACMYFVESVYNPFAFPATLCDSWDNFKSGKCDGNAKVFMGPFTPTSTKGTFFLKTNSAPPYGEKKSNAIDKEETIPPDHSTRSKYPEEFRHHRGYDSFPIYNNNSGISDEIIVVIVVVLAVILVGFSLMYIFRKPIIGYVRGIVIGRL